MLTTSQALPAVADEVPVPRLRRLMWQALTLPIAATLLLAGLLVRELVVVGAAAEEAGRARAVIAEVHHAHRLVLEQEAALRGHVVDRRDMFFTPLQIGQAAMPAALARLAALVADDPEQQGRAHALREAIAAWSASATPAVEASLADEAARLGAREGQLDAIRRHSRGLIAAEEARLAATIGPTRWFWLLVGALGLGLIAATTVVLRRWIRRMEGIYARALALRRDSEARERAAREVAEALAVEVTAQSRELQARFRALRAELERARMMRQAV